MKQLIVIVMACISMGLHAQNSADNSIEKTVGEFKELKVYDLIKVNLIKSDVNKVVITGKNTDQVETINKNGILKVRMALTNSFNGDQTKVNVHYTTIDVIDVNEGATVSAEDTIEQFEIELKAQEGGVIEIPVKVSFVVVKADTGGEITTSGTAKNEQINISTGGIYNGESLESESASVAIKAAGEAHIRTEKTLDAKIRAGGDIYIYGHPETVNENKVLGGRILRVD